MRPTGMCEVRVQGRTRYEHSDPHGRGEIEQHMEHDYRRPAGMWGVTSTGMCEVEFCQEQEPRAASGTAAEMYELELCREQQPSCRDV